MSNSDIWFWTIVAVCAVVGFLVGFFDKAARWTTDAHGRRRLVRHEREVQRVDESITRANIQAMADMQKQVYINNLGKK